MNHKYLILGIGMIGAFIFGVVLFSTCNPISNKCFANEKSSNNVQVIASLNPQEFKGALESGDYKLIDIRTAEEFGAGHITGSENIDFYKSMEFSNYLDSLDKNDKYLIYCRSGNRSGKALSMMKAKGFENVSDLQGGINSWVNSGFPIN